MSWTKSALQILAPVIATIVAVDAIAYFGFKDKIQTVLPGYGVNIANFDRGYPRFHFKADEELGFDITADFQTTTSTKPAEYKTYDVWGNSFGCFDDEWSTEDQQGGVYIAGDSFMWGYVSYDRKTGTLLQQQIDQPVYECGVTHTGQRHQFEKFKRNFELGIIPSVVIVNMTWNDVNNDFFFPHTTVVEGYMVETVEQCGYYENDNYSYSKMSYEEAEAVVADKLNAPTTFKSILRDYSLTANVAFQLIRAVPSAPASTDAGSDAAPLDCRVWLYGGAYETLGSDYTQSELSAPNREAIAEWVAHASSNNYDIVFSLIPAKSAETPNYPFIQSFVESAGAPMINFEEFISDNDLERSTLYYEMDEHFNETGNEHYATFLAAKLSEFID